MDSKVSQAAVRSYQHVGSVGALTDARPYDVVQMMLATAITRIAQAKGCMQRNEVSSKGETIGKALGILEGLTMSLDPARGGEIAANLARLYDYVAQRLIQANLGNDPALLDEAATLLSELKSGWEGIPVELRG
jgi:flagellar secretion chaperone FliS